MRIPLEVCCTEGRLGRLPNQARDLDSELARKCESLPSDSLPVPVVEPCKKKQQQHTKEILEDNIKSISIKIKCAVLNAVFLFMAARIISPRVNKRFIGFMHFHASTNDINALWADLL